MSFPSEQKKDCSSVENLLVRDYHSQFDIDMCIIADTNNTLGCNAREEVITSRRDAADEETIYSYDTIGNRLWSASNASTNSYSANCLNQHTAISNLCGSASLREPSYDADGNLISDSVFRYAYDAENRLRAVTSASLTNGAVRVLNSYDNNHRRVRKTAKRLMFHGGANSPEAPPMPQSGEWTTAETRTYVWDGNNIALELTANPGDTTRVCEYFWGPDLSGTEQGAGGVGGLLAVSIDGVFHIPCYDHNGNIVRYVSETGAVSASYSYDPFGNIIAATAPIAEDFTFGFSTKPLDRQTGLISYQRRFYSPFFGRWLNRDPIAESGGENNSSPDKTAYGTSCDGNDTHVEPRHVFDAFGDMVQRLIRTNETDFTSETLSYTYGPIGRHVMRNDDSFVYNMRGGKSCSPTLPVRLRTTVATKSEIPLTGPSTT